MKKEKWVISAKRADFADIGKTFGIDPVTARLIRNRDVITDEEIREFLSGSFADLHDPMLLCDMEKAADIITEKIAGGASIRVIGDYDIDGVMASYILMTRLEELGGNCTCAIPDRMEDGYGVSIRMIEEALEDGVDTIITCDNGIAANNEVKLAKEYGMTVIVTDHHEVLSIPEADAVINPHRPDCPYPYKDLCGASVAYKLISALKKKAGVEDDGELLSYAAFATVGDIMSLTGENRIIVKEGLKRLRNTNNTGLLALCEACQIDPSKIDTYHIGFVLGPCINAAGRLGSAMRSFDLLRCKDRDEANTMALELRGANDSRKAMTEDGVIEASKLVENDDSKVYFLYLPKLHESIAGIVAGRVREMTSHPVFVLSDSGDIAKGSGRSTPEYSMFEELVRVEELMVKYGGHPMAAGLSLKRETIDEFRRRLNESCTLTEEDFYNRVLIDMEMPFSYITEKLIEEMEVMAPFGKANSKPLFGARLVEVKDARILGAKGNVFKCVLKEKGRYFDGVCFKDVDELYEAIKTNPFITIAYYPEINTYGGNRRIQIVIEHWRQ